MKKIAKLVALASLMALPGALPATAEEDPFRQLEEMLPSPNVYRTASGAPGPAYWQQRADYAIEVTLDDEHQSLTGSAQITYTNQSPDTLNYLWLQLDGNLFTADSASFLARRRVPFEDEVTFETLAELLDRRTLDGSFHISRVASANDEPLQHTVVKTMMRIDLSEALAPGASTAFTVDWERRIVDADVNDARGGYEYFERDSNYIYEMAQWFPRMAAYTDVNGWQHKQFLGDGEFTLEMGNYRVSITVPADHVVASTGVLQNPEEVLTGKQRQRLEESRKASKPVFIVTPEEALENEQSQTAETRTWVFAAENVRDFAWASSRRFIWDAIEHTVDGQAVMAMSFYPNEGEPLWSRYSTQAIVHTLDVYSHFTFPYPYPVAISVNGPVGGMEYPMISFNGPRPETDGTYSKSTKYGLISVVIHEVGHNYFPMIVNSDERQWTWMDEGVNSFLQFLAERQWEEDYPSKRGEPTGIVEFMTSENQVPIMTNSESLQQFSNNAYAKPAAALTILRETILGRELFDFAFREYSRRWMFKRPMPADFFRTMEDASAVDLDWFWRGWFYSSDHTDLAISGVKRFILNTGDPEIDKKRRSIDRAEAGDSLTEIRNQAIRKRVADHPDLEDFYSSYDELDVTATDREEYEQLLESLTPSERAVLETKTHFYVVEIENIGGLVMPVLLKIDYEDGSSEEIRVPTEIWRYDSRTVEKLLMTEKLITRITLDPHRETADADLSNNLYPPQPVERYFSPSKEEEEPNPMREEGKES